MMKRVMKDVKGIDIEDSFPIMTYDDAMNRYGSDKPDTRFAMELTDLSEIVKDCGFKVLSGALAAGGVVKSLVMKGQADAYSRKDIDPLGEYAAIYGAKGLAWLKVEDDGMKGPIAKLFSEEEKTAIVDASGAEVGDIILFGADSFKVV